MDQADTARISVAASSAPRFEGPRTSQLRRSCPPRCRALVRRVCGGPGARRTRSPTDWGGAARRSRLVESFASSRAGYVLSFFQPLQRSRRNGLRSTHTLLDVLQLAELLVEQTHRHGRPGIHRTSRLGCRVHSGPAGTRGRSAAGRRQRSPHAWLVAGSPDRKRRWLRRPAGRPPRPTAALLLMRRATRLHAAGCHAQADSPRTARGHPLGRS
jgi:hypothetical protein